MSVFRRLPRTQVRRSTLGFGPARTTLAIVQDRFQTISFLSDYGHRDEFVGTVKSVMRSIAAHAEIIDITHEIAPHDIRAGGLALARSAQYLMPGVVLAVVDPGVGTDRKGLAIEVGGGQSVLVGPDNGLLAPAVALVGGATRAVALTNTEYHLEAPGATFDGRDIFGPVAAHLAMGTPIGEFGDDVDPAGLMPGMVPVSERNGDELSCDILWVDRFGNLQLNIDPDDLADFEGDLMLRSRDLSRMVRRVDNYAEIGTGAIGMLVDSYGLMSLAITRGSAEDELGLHEGDQITLSEPGETGQASATTTPVQLQPRGR